MVPSVVPSRVSFGQLKRALLDPSAQGTAFEEGHDDKRPPLGFVDFVNCADIRVIEPGSGLGFTLEAPAGFVVAKQMRREKFQGYGTIELGALGLVNDAHSAFTELFGDLVVADDAPDHDAAIVASCG